MSRSTKTPTPQPTPASGIAERVHGMLQPYFQMIPDQSYPRDFYEHDLTALRKRAVAGATLWWVAGQSGTHLLFEGVDPDLAHAATEGSDKCRFMRVDVGHHTDRLTEFADRAALVADVRATPSITRRLRLSTMDGARRPDGAHTQQVSVTSDSGLLATASLVLRRQNATMGAPQAEVQIEVRKPGMQPKDVLVIVDRVGDHVAAYFGTLFWQQIGPTLIDGLPQVEWLDARRRPAQPSLLADPRTRAVEPSELAAAA